MADKRRGGGQNVGGGTVIALQPDYFGVGKIFFKAQNVFDFRSAPGIDRLVVVADAAQVAVFLADQTEKQVLGDVGVLILVDHDVFEARLVVVQYAGVGHQNV